MYVSRFFIFRTSPLFYSMKCKLFKSDIPEKKLQSALQNRIVGLIMKNCTMSKEKKNLMVY